MKQFLKNLSLRAKLLGNSAILLTLLVLSSSYAIKAMNNIGGELSTIAEQDIPLTKKLTAITTYQQKQVLQFERSLHYGAVLPQKDTNAALRKAEQAFNEGTDSIMLLLAEARSALNTAIKTASRREQEKFKSINNALKNIEQQHHNYVKHAHSAFAAINQRKIHIAEQLANKVEQEEEKLDKELESLLAKIGQFTEASALRADEHELAATSTLGMIAIISLILGTLVSWFIANFIVSAIRRTIVTASGDLSQSIEVDSTDEIGELLSAMNGMRQKLLDMLAQISGTTEQLSA
ncbi:MAG TPA: HAMP domain-containing protein, partial [Gammaproteobacteria bacterium]|nr:HAMP domain-containing protein [Gammaproteobacteria bacterium]